MTKRMLLAVLACVPFPAAHASPPAASAQAAIVARIEADVAEMVAGINAKDIGKATKFDAPDLVSMESMREPSVGAAADREGLSMAFRYAPQWHLRLIDQAVEVARSGEMAVYRSTYHEDSQRNGVAYTHKVNFLVGFRRDADGTWRAHWSIVCAQSPSQKA